MEKSPVDHENSQRSIGEMALEQRSLESDRCPCRNKYKNSARFMARASIEDEVVVMEVPQIDTKEEGYVPVPKREYITREEDNFGFTVRRLGCHEKHAAIGSRRS